MSQIVIANVETKVSGLSQIVSKAITAFELNHNDKDIDLTIEETTGGEADRLIRKIGKRRKDPFTLDIEAKGNQGNHTKRLRGLKVTSHRFNNNFSGNRHLVTIQFKSFQILDENGDIIPDTLP